MKLLSSRSLLLGFLLVFVLSACGSEPGASSSEGGGTMADSATNESMETGDNALADATLLDSVPVTDSGMVDTSEMTEGNALRTSGDSGPPIPKPGDVDPTQILEDPLAKKHKLHSNTSPQNQGGVAGCWTDSREEYNRGSGPKVFRPCGFKKFPPSRFRFRMDLRTDGSCEWLGLAANDAHSMKPGTWTYDKESNELIVSDEAGKEIHRYEVLEVNKELLKVKEK